MYLIPIHVPIYVDGARTLVTTEWKRSLLLLRDSLGGRFGPLALLAPSLPAGGVSADQLLEELSEEHDGIRPVPSFDARCRTREYWGGPRRRWRSQVLERLPEAEVLHGCLNDVYRPFPFAAFLLAARASVPTLFVQDTDIVLQMKQLARSAGAKARLKALAYGVGYERMCRRGVALADLSLIKGRSTIRRYAPHARNIREIQDTSYTTAEIVDEATVEHRAEDLRAGGRPIRLVYCGRLVGRKGVDRGIRLLAGAIRRGARLELDVIGDGPDRAMLGRLAADEGIAASVRFRGLLPYGPDLIRELAGYDALYFTPLAEDTPRMIFDGYAAGLPLVGAAIDYVRERAEGEGATVLLPFDDDRGAVDVLVGLAEQPERLAALAAPALKAADYHAADSWYRRRAEWTFEAVDRRRSAVSLT